MRKPKYKFNDTVQVNLNGRIEFLIYLQDSGQRTKSGKIIGKWLCFCGNEFFCSHDHIAKSHTKSCHCWTDTCNKNNRKDHTISYINKIHAHIKDKCYNLKNDDYDIYGGRGIKVQEDWKDDTKKFVNDLLNKIGHRPTEKHSLDRINVNGDYEINNIKWATSKEQARNRRNTLRIIYKGEERIVAELSEQSNISVDTIMKRKKRNWSDENLLNPVKKSNKEFDPTDLYAIFNHIYPRTNIIEDEDYYNYGAKNIKMYEPWINNYKKFKEDLLELIGPRTSIKHTLDRIDYKGNYEPGNLKWSTNSEQQNNKSTNRKVTINGITKNLTIWAKENNLNHKALSWRINNWPEEKWLIPVQTRKINDELVIQKIRNKYTTNNYSISKLRIEYNLSNDIILNILHHRGAYSK